MTDEDVYSQFYLACRTQLARKSYARLSAKFPDVSIDTDSFKAEMLEIFNIIQEAELFMAPPQEFASSGLRPGFNGMNDSKNQLDRLNEEIQVFVSNYFASKYVKVFSAAGPIFWLLFDWQTNRAEGRSLTEMFDEKFGSMAQSYFQDNPLLEDGPARRSNPILVKWNAEAKAYGWW